MCCPWWGPVQLRCARTNPKKKLVEQITCLDLRSHTKDWILREILFHDDADAVVQHCEPGSEKNVGFRYTRFARVEDQSTSGTDRGIERPVFNIRYPQVNLACISTKLDQKREMAGARNASSLPGPLLSGMKGVRNSSQDCVQGTETGREVDQSSPSNFTLPQTNNHTDAIERGLK